MEPPMFVPSKRARAPHNSSQVASCMVDGCNSDLSKCREYHRRHKVCELHSKTPKVTIRGEEQRFCQQCSRFHYLVEFDDAKRSCRKRLDGHNRRRRKPQPDTSSQNSTSQFFSNSNYEVAKFVQSGSPQAFLSSGLGSSCSWASPVDKTMSSHHHQTASMRSIGDKKVPSFSYGGASSGLFKSAQIQFPFLQDGSSTRQQEPPLIASHPNHHHHHHHQQAAPFLGTAVSSSDRALSLLSSLPPQAAPESSCSQKPPSRAPSLFEPSLLPTQLRLSASDATTSNASVLVSQGMMFQITRYDDDSESSSASGSRPLHHHATSFSWD